MIDQFLAFTFLIAAFGLGLVLLGLAEKALILATKRPRPPRPQIKSVSDAEMAEWNRCLTAVGYRDQSGEDS